MMPKDPAILDLLTRLELPRRGWMIVDHWDGDLTAIGIASAADSRRLVYVATVEERKDVYYYECEAPNGSELTEYVVVETGHDVDFESLEEALQRHLEGAKEGGQ